MDDLPPLLVATFGNPLAGDDAVGHMVAERIRARPMEGVEVVELGLRPMGLLDHLQGRSGLYIVDAVRVAGVPPGRVVDMDWFGPERPLLEIEKGMGSTHALSVAHVIALAERLALLPRAVRVLGLTVRRPELGRPATGAVRRNVQALVRRIERRAAAGRKAA
jgi:hydrogenase maturation protease